MSLNSIYSSLNAKLSGGNIRLDGTVLSDLTPLLAKLGLTSLPVTSATLSLKPAAVVLTGSATFLSRAWTVTLTGESPDDKDRLTLKLQGTGTPLTIHDLFGAQPPSLIVSPDGVFVLGDSVLDPLPVAYSAFVAATDANPQDPKPARFQGTLSLTGTPLARYAAFLLTNELQLDGTAVFPPAGTSGIAVLALEAISPISEIGSIPGIQGPIQRSGLAFGNQGTDDNLPATQKLSTVEFFATITNPTTARISAPLLRNDGLWPLQIIFPEKGLSLQNGMKTIVSFFGGDADLLDYPSGIDLLKSFYISVIGLGIDPGLDNTSPSLVFSTIAIDSDQPWNSPVPFITVKNIGLTWMFRWLRDRQRSLICTGTVFGTFTFGADKNRPGSGWDLDVLAFLPQFDIWISSSDPLTIPIGDAFKQFNLGIKNTPGNLVVTNVDMLAQMSEKILNASMTIEGDWAFTVGKITFTFEQLTLSAMVSANSVSGSIVGIMSIVIEGSTDPKVVLMMSAEYPSGGNWIFSGGLESGTLPLTDFVLGFLGLSPPGWLPTLDLVQLNLRYDTGNHNPYLAQGKVVSNWDVTDALGIKLALEAAGRIERKPSPDDSTKMISSGDLSGSFQINKVKVTAGLSFEDTTKIYFFMIDWDDKEIKAVASQITTRLSGQHYILTISLRGITIGSLVEGFVNLINPNLNYHLDSPWDFLNSIDLSRFTLVIDPTENRFELNFRVDLGLPFMHVDTVGVVYDRSSGESSVYFKLTGQLLNKTYDDDKPLTWDAVNDPPPEVPGKGTKLLNLRYLGLGQHVTLKDIKTYQSVAGVINAMREDMLPPKNQDKDPSTNPIANMPKLRFAAESQWLIGFDITILEFVRVAIVLNDPYLYGLLIELSGPKSKSLNGLSFELLYKKVTDDIGVFRVRLQVPEAFRQLDFGAVSITLGVITVDIFTNGNFRVDLGFPANRNFDNSFGFQVGPFIGRGGLYFAVLNGATSEHVPRVTNGEFSPVLELGLGLAVGLGRTFNKGPLSAGLYVEVEGIFTGVLAWFHPNDAANDTSLFYSCRATVAISGKVYGKVDFKIISVSVSIEAYASVSLTVQCYMPIVIELSVGVEVEAEVDLFFFSVSFSFSMTLEFSFTIGEAQPTPWILSADQSGKELHQAGLSAAGPHRRRAADMIRHTNLPARNAFFTGNTWNPDVTLFSNGQPVQVNLTMLPVLPIAGIPVQWEATPPPPPPSPDYEAAFMLTSPVPGTTDNTGNDISFNNLIRIAVLWSLTGIGIPPFGSGSTVTPANLDALAVLLQDPATADAGFNYSALDTLFGKNLLLRIDGRPAQTNIVSGVAFPMIPALGWANATLPLPADQTRDFGSYMPVDSSYEKDLRRYLNEPLPGETAVSSGNGDSDTATESLATFVFRDYFMLIAKSAVDEAKQIIAGLSYSVNLGRSLNDIAGDFLKFDGAVYIKVDGDNVDQVAADFGLSTGELIFLNPDIVNTIEQAAAGATINITLGVTPNSIAAANGSAALSGGTRALGDLRYQVRAADTLKKIADSFGFDLKSWMNWKPQPDKPAEVLSQVRLLAPGSTLPLGADYVYLNTQALSLSDLNPVFFVRLFGYAGIPRLEWYAQAIVNLNPTIMTGPNGDTDNLPNPLIVPSAYQSLSNPLNWTPLTGDTLLDAAGYFALKQNQDNPNKPFTDFAAAMAIRNPGPDFSRILLPLNTVTQILPAETLETLAKRLLLDPTQSLFATIVGPASILQPLAGLMLRGTSVTVEADATFADLSARYGISVQELGGRFGVISGIFNTGKVTALTIPHLVKMSVDDLLLYLLKNDTATQISNQVSRFMLSGLRIPEPKLVDGKYKATGPLTGLYKLTGQQVQGVGPDAAKPEPRLSVTFTMPGAQKNWIRLGAVLPGSLAVSVSNADLNNYAPNTVLSPEFNPQFNTPLRASQLWQEQKMRWDIQQHLLWQTAKPVTLPPPTPPADPGSTMPGIWPLPDGLLERAGKSGVSYKLRTLDPRKPDQAQDVKFWEWTCLIDFSVRRIPGSPGLCEVQGADTAQRQILLQAWNYIATPHPGAVTLLYRQPATGVGLSGGLVSPPLSPTSGAYLIKTNLSTETHSGMNGLRRTFAAADIPPAVCAPISDAANFLMLLWECSVVGGGYWLQADGPDKTPALPDAIFGSDGSASLSVLITIDSQTRTSPLRELLSFNNCAVIGDAIDLSAVHLVAEAVNDPTAVVRLPSVQPGNVGFSLSLLRPPKPSGTNSPAESVNRTRRYYQLAGYYLLPNQVFKGTAPSVPVGPQKGPPTTAAPGRDVWDLSQVIPAARFAQTYKLPAMTGLPVPAPDPYAGIQLVAPNQLGAVRVQAWFQDMLGNATAGAPVNPAALTEPVSTPLAAGEVDIPVGYMDPVIGITNWPAITASFSVKQSGVNPQLSVDLGFQSSAYLPGPTGAADGAIQTAADHQARYARIYYQVMQDKVQGNLLTTLKTDSNGKPVRLADNIAGLRGYAAAAYAFLTTASALKTVSAAATCHSLNDIINRYGVWFDGLAVTNANVTLSAVFAPGVSGPKIKLPKFALFKQGDTAQSLSTGGLDPAAILQDDLNKVLPLRAGVELSIPVRSVQTPLTPSTITALAAQEKCSVSSLVAANTATKDLLKVTFVFEFGGAKVTVDNADMTLNDVSAKFGELGTVVTALTLGTSNADMAGVFAVDKAFQVGSYTAVQNAAQQDTMSQNGSGVDLATLAGKNIRTADLFAAGTPVFLQSVDGSSVFDSSLSDAARTFGITGEQLLAFNAATPLATGAGALPPILPGQTLLQPDQNTRIPYGIAAHDTLDLIAGLFLPVDPNDPVFSLASANVIMPIIAGGKEVTIGSQSITTRAGDSLQSVTERFTTPPVQLRDVVDFLRAKPDYLLTGGILLCPPAKAVSTDLVSLGTKFNFLDPSPLAFANASVTGILQPGKTFTLTRDGKTFTVPTASDPDNPTGPSPFTLNSIVASFAMQHVDVTLDEVIDKNKSLDVLVPNAKLLLPPPLIKLSADLITDQTFFPAAIFPVHAWVEIWRSDRDLVLPDFRGTGDELSPTEACRSSIAPQGAEPGSSTLKLKQFASDLQQALGMLRVCTGKVVTPESRDTDVWAVGFGPGLIERVSVQPPFSNPAAPQFFALRPLFNHLVSKQGVNIAPLKDGNLDTAAAMNFQGIDVETWASDFLADVDLFLSAVYAAAAYRGTARVSLESVIRTKSGLADAVASGLDYVLDPNPPTLPIQNDRKSACDFLKQRLLISLSRAWDVDVMLQYNSATTIAPKWAGSLKARLSGAASKESLATTNDGKRVGISGAKIDLEVPQSFVNFGVTLQKPSEVSGSATFGEAMQSYLDLNLGYDINETEFNIKPAEQGYEASDWLSFVLPPPDQPVKPPGWNIALGTTRAPLPLRNYPTPAVLISQSAQRTYPDTTDIGKASQWTYLFTYRHASAAQDQIRFDVVFNEPSTMFGADFVVEDDLFSALAQYQAVRAPLWDILKNLPTAPPVQPNTPLANAAATFAALVQRVSSMWNAHWAGAPPTDWASMKLNSAALLEEDDTPSLPQLETYSYVTTSEWRIDPLSGNSYYVALDLERRTDSTGAVTWPDIKVTAGEQTYDLEGQTPSGQLRRYTFPAGSEVLVGAQLDVGISFPGLHLGQYQKATSRVNVIRNARLLGPQGQQTRDGFIFMTPPVTFADHVVPLLVWDSFDIGVWAADGSRLATAMSQLLDGAVTGDRPVSFCLQYGYDLVPGTDLRTLLPISMRPITDYASADAATIAGQLTEWQRINHPSTANAEWVFSVTAYSVVDPLEYRPILEIRQLLSSITST